MSEKTKELSPEEKLWAVKENIFLEKAVPILLRINTELPIPVSEDG